MTSVKNIVHALYGVNKLPKN